MNTNKSLNIKKKVLNKNQMKIMVKHSLKK